MNPGKLKKFVLMPFFWLLNMCFSIPVALAVDTSSFNVNTYLSAPGQEHQPTSISQYLLRLVNFLTLLIGSFAFLAIVVGGIMLMTSAGNTTQETKGKDILKYAITGLVIAMAAYFITAFVQSIFYDYGTASK